VREVERKHLAREVHDELGQLLTGLRMDMSVLEMRFGAQNPGLADKVQGMKSLLDRAIQGVRHVVSNLRPTALDLGLIAALESVCTEFTQRTGIACVFHTVEQAVDLDEARAVVVFRIVQESLTNVMRHACASHVSVTLCCDGNTLELEVRDNGHGFDPIAAAAAISFGLLGMRERAHGLGGRVDIISAPGQGVVVGLTIPVDATDQGEP
jgi:signal transduction histidine kinase